MKMFGQKNTSYNLSSPMVMLWRQSQMIKIECTCMKYWSDDRDVHINNNGH